MHKLILEHDANNTYLFHIFVQVKYLGEGVWTGSCEGAAVQAKWWTSCFTCAVGLRPLVFSLLYMLEYVCVVLDAWRLELWSIAMLLPVGPLVFLL